MSRPNQLSGGGGVGGAPPGLARYGSAPVNFLAAASVSIGRGSGGPPAGLSRVYAGESSGLTTCESSCRGSGGGPMERPAYGSGEAHAAAGQLGAPLFRHSSSPAGLFSRLLASDHNGSGSHSQASCEAANTMTSRKLNSQWSFPGQVSLQQPISGMGMIPDIGESSNEAADHVTQSYLSRSFSVSSWDDTNPAPMLFSSPGKKGRESSSSHEFVSSLSDIESQYGLPRGSLEISDMGDYLQMQQDETACKIRAKRGCATHPRSIAERERRTRISKRLKKLQDLVPNMDKQTSTSDMLDLAVHYIRELQGQVEKLKREQDICTCARSD